MIMVSLEIFFFYLKKLRAQCNFVRFLILKAKSNFLTNLVTESSSNPHTLWKTLNSIYHHNPSNSSPDTHDTQSLANSFLQICYDKIEQAMRTKLNSYFPFECFNELGPTIINIINFFLSDEIFSSLFKQAIVHALLKKPSLPDDDLNNFRPISNLNFISKILKKVVALSYPSYSVSPVF